MCVGLYECGRAGRVLLTVIIISLGHKGCVKMQDG